MDKDKKSPKINKSGISKVKGKNFVSYDAKLDYAHQFGFKSLKVETVQIPSDANGQRCVCKAELQTEDGRTFVDIGDATPDNVPHGCVDSFMRVASTRAKSRVIEDAYNISLFSQDEIKSNEIDGLYLDNSKYINVLNNTFALNNEGFYVGKNVDTFTRISLPRI